MIVFITGATAGFGEAFTRRFIAAGHTVIGTGRRAEKLEALHNEFGEQFYPLAFDVCDATVVSSAISSLPKSLQKIDILINNAGLALGINPAQTADLTDWQTMINTNVTGTVNVTHAILPLMIAQQSGLIINLGSTAGNWPYFGGNVYGASKAFIKQFSQNLRVDLHGTGIRVTNIEPGLVGGTEFSNVRFKGDDAKAAQMYKDKAPLMAEDIAETVFWVASCPAHMNINSIELMPTTQSPAGLQVFTKP